MKLFSIPHRFSFTALLLLLLQLMQVQNGFAQAPLVKMWDYRFGGTSTDQFWTFQQTTDKGYMLAGDSYSGIGGDKSQPTWGHYDYWIVKLDSFGNKQWDKDFGGTNQDNLFSVQQTDDGGYIIGGWSNSDSSGDKTEPSRGLFDYWIIKMDSLGNKQWDKSYGGSDYDEFRCLQQTNDGGYILGGGSSSGIGGEKTMPSKGGIDFWILKIDALGNVQWDKDFGGTSNDMLTSLQVTTDGGFILGGYSDSGISGDKTQPTWGYRDYWIVKTDSLGSFQWDKDFGGFNVDGCYCLRQTDDGGYILGGNSYSGISGDKSQANWDSSGLTSDYWIVKTDSLGNIQWDKDFGGDDDEGWFENVAQTIDGGYLLSGESLSHISGNKTESNLGYQQTWIVKTDSSGNLQWEKTILSPKNNNSGYAIQTSNQCYAITDRCDGGIGGYKTQPSQGGDDYWIIKFCDTTISYVPSISLASSDTTFCEKNCLDFIGLSTNNPTSWQWHFPGASPDTSTLQNPTNICYNTYGTYDVTLVACNQFGCDSITFSNFITCYQNPVDSIYGANDTLWSTVAVSYQWYETTSGIISGATNQYYVPVQLGSYFCVVTDSNGCEANSNVITITADPLTPKGGTIQIQPNPATDFVALSISPFGGQGACSLEIFDVNGSIVIHQNIDDKNKINISSLAKGVYGYRIISNDKILQQGKLLKM